MRGGFQWGAVFGAILGCFSVAFLDSRHTLDQVQAKFETSDPHGYNWPVFRQANSLAKLKCRDINRKLRVCDVAMPAIDPVTMLQDGWVQSLRPVTFADLVLDAPIQALLDEMVVELEYRDELAERKLRARNRFLFCGPPGNGKSSSAAAVAEALGVAAYGVSLPQLIGSRLGETGSNLGELFDAIRPDTVVVFDEIDALGSRRGAIDSAAGKEQNSTINTLLTLLDRCKYGVIVATTNRPDMLDPALLRRFDETIEFPAPTVQQLAALGEKLCEGYGVSGVRVTDCRNFDEVAKRCETEARRIVMREILAAEETGDSDGEEET